jgi:MFS family permease
LAPAVGLRATFLVAAAFYLTSVVLVAMLYTEPRTRQARSAGRRLGEVLGELYRTPGFVMVFMVILCLQLVDRSFGPILPLYVELLGLPPSRVALVSGVLFSVAALFAALGHHVAEPMMLRWSARALIVGTSVATSAGLLLLVLVPSLWALAVALAVSGVAIGVGMTSAYTSGGRLLPPDAHATGFGVMTTASLVGLAVSPIVAGFISGPGLRVVFEADILLLALLAVVAWVRMDPGVSHPQRGASGTSAS